MENLIWNILGIVSVISLFFFWSKKNAVWGGFTIASIIGLILALIFKDWSLVPKSMVIGTLLGLVAESLGIIGTRIRKK